MVVDVETAGFNERTDALLQIAAVILDIDEQGQLYCEETVACHVNPFPGANLDPKSMEVNGIDVDHPFRMALDERDALPKIFKPVRAAVRKHHCNKAILVGHNAHFDLKFVNVAAERSGIKREMRRREYYEKPSETNRRARLRAERRSKRNRMLAKR